LPGFQEDRRNEDAPLAATADSRNAMGRGVHAASMLKKNPEVEAA
jgi:hypothetical protein